MKRNKLAKKLTAALLSGAMVMSMGGMTAFADPETPGTTTENESISSVPIKKYLLTDGKTYAPNTKFSFNITTGETTSYQDGGKEYPVTAGPIDAVSIAPIGFSSEDAITNKYTKDGSLVFTVTEFEDPGIYSYKITEDKESKYEGVDYSDEEYEILVFVEADDNNNNYVAAVTATKKGGTTSTFDPTNSKAAAIEFTNNYGGDDEEYEDEVYELVVKKTVSGNQGDKTESFNFDITITDQDVKGEVYNAVIYNENGDTVGDPIRMTSGSAQPISLSHGQEIRIYGLSANDAYVVNEDDYSNDGYTTTYTVTANNVADSNSSISEVNGKQDSVSGSPVNNDIEVTVDNNKHVNTPTGIAMTFAPYAVMVVFAGVFAVMFLRKKREEF